MSGNFDIAIVGGGPAGLSAGIFLARYLHSVVLIDSGDPRNWETRGINCYLGLPNIKPSDLRELGRAEMRTYDVTLVDDCIQQTRKQSDEQFVLIAQSGAEVYARDKKTVVIGSGRKAAGMALNLSTWTREIIICTNGLPPDLDDPEYCQKLDALNIPVLTEKVLRVREKGGRVRALELESGMELDAEKIFFAIGQYPADDLGAQLGCKRDAGGHIIVDEHYHTSVTNVFAAGDIVPGAQLAIAAAAAGAIAALAMHKSLVPEGRKLALTASA
jgi:thioredoxin reductase